MGNRKSSPGPKPGDLIEIQRFGYQHWAIYIGGGYVIHLTLDGGSGVGSILGLSSSTINAVVKKELLSKVTGILGYRVNNGSDKKWKPLTVKKIIKNAKAKVGDKMEYKLTTANCEHFVNQLRYGVKVSYQPQDAIVNGTALAVAGAGAVVAVGVCIVSIPALPVAGAAGVGAGVGAAAAVGAGAVSKMLRRRK